VALAVIVTSAAPRAVTAESSTAGPVVLATNSGAVGSFAVHRVEVIYDTRADVLSIRLRDGEPKYVLVGRGTFVVFADDRGVWAVDLEAESWDADPETALRQAGAEIW
jgi:hypothetical protein